MHASRGFFPGQRDNEEVLLVVRHHWIRDAANYLWTLGFVGLAVLAVWLGQWLAGPVRELGGAALGMLLLFVWLRFFLEQIRHDFCVLILTNHRVMHARHGHFIDIRFQEANLDRVQDVAGRVHGMLMSLLNVGDLRIDLQNQNATETLVLKQIAAPHETARHILDLYRQHARHILAEKRGGNQPISGLQARAGEDLPAAAVAQLRSSHRRRATDR